MNSTYWPTLLTFLAGNLGFLGLFYCYRRGQRRLLAEEAAQHMEVTLQQQILQDRSREAFGSLQQQHRRRRGGMSMEELAKLLVSGTVLRTTSEEVMADFGVDRPLCAILSCAICLNDYTHGEVIQGSHHCQHVFHAECILKWLVKHQECPCCRTDYGTVEEEVQESFPNVSAPNVSAPVLVSARDSSPDADSSPDPILSTTTTATAPNVSATPDVSSPDLSPAPDLSPDPDRPAPPDSPDSDIPAPPDSPDSDRPAPVLSTATATIPVSTGVAPDPK